MINFFSEINFKLPNSKDYEIWLQSVLESEKKRIGELNYIFCDDEYLHEINLKYLNHDTYTDIISFDYSEVDKISGDIFISIERVKENAEKFQVNFNTELQRVIVHGVLHFIGYKDHTNEEKKKMRTKEEEKIEMFHVEQ
ncbi:rRNA maturation RNase YbeY [Mesonia maritima]|uniref:Endoribonuclease YbeY n=1 Tax=Mesonia maritima TaxID=1793873 RepID=A0ABU1K2G6_9FLAO|nr:rRNA maturation RNase YbeY [Mesonia maritima]MDR6299798.1 rRNA maturation RNase YbeY [Mesonia maritima]